ncbi:calcium-binding protein [Actinoplanes utahensis]|uniref:Calcium-binding protein n=1 Tax=Actinoplanes utahensis TaxID=1869 RepID=A0A0A6UPJ4_ACTUT|nr:calcium-binding protein [Actinoplanes utahensis]KHD76229.1 hypothetical protein MB27_17525 [Actinoplanes utahensis]GIF30845.1 hypothetical protein Aut01nite_38310 [Actinoplanes utahensis]
MNVVLRRTLAALGATAAAVASTAVLASPAQAATSGIVKVIGTNRVEFRALLGVSNAVVLTISGRTVTIDDRVALTAGAGCSRVDSTKVRCTTSAATARLDVWVGDRNDYVRNDTGVFMLAGGANGDDTLIGGSGRDQLQGGAGNDKLLGRNGQGELWGDVGHDYIYGGTGYDYVVAGPGSDYISTAGSDDLIHGQDGNDRIYSGAGNDTVSADAGNDLIYGGVGDDYVIGGVGNDSIGGEAGDDKLIAENYKRSGNAVVSSPSATARDGLYAGAGADICLRSARTVNSGCEYYTAVA